MNDRGACFLHGISDGSDHDRHDWTAPCVAELTRWGRGFDEGWSPDTREIYYASLMQDLAGPLGKLGAVGDYASDLKTYSSPTNREKILDHIEAQILAAGRGRVLIAHSLGSVAAFDLCCAWLCAGEFQKPREQWPCSSLVTLGSPLGLPPAPGPLDEWLNRGEAAALMPCAFPAEFRWLNFADKDDVVVTGAKLGVVPNFEDIEGYKYIAPGLSQRPSVDTGGRFTSHVG